MARSAVEDALCQEIFWGVWGAEAFTGWDGRGQDGCLGRRQVIRWLGSSGQVARTMDRSDRGRSTHSRSRSVCWAVLPVSPVSLSLSLSLLLDSGQSKWNPQNWGPQLFFLCPWQRDLPTTAISRVGSSDSSVPANRTSQFGLLPLLVGYRMVLIFSCCCCLLKRPQPPSLWSVRRK